MSIHKIINLEPITMQVLRELVNSDLNETQIAQKLNIPPLQVYKHLGYIRKELEVRTNYGAIIAALQHDLVEINEKNK